MGGQKGRKVYRGLLYSGFYTCVEFWKDENIYLNI